MKTKLFSIVAPLAIAALGFGGAVQNNAAEQSESKTASLPGYKHVSAPQNCQQVQDCANTGNFVCKSDIDGSTLYRLDSSNPNVCPSILMRTTP
ncbi:hypothetical protein ACLI09_01750 [Flavobacterium sp. RHBU_24]|uniref:hypothetical protein n=1 Tax=Flavobacterium sp. RHBU_24 TaxID=3391185 RepID=UPI0039848BF2